MLQIKKELKWNKKCHLSRIVINYGHTYKCMLIKMFRCGLCCKQNIVTKIYELTNLYMYIS